MTAVKLASLETFLKKQSIRFGAVLFYGADPVAVRGLAASTVKQLAGSLDDPFRVVVIDDTELSADAGQLADHVQSQSLLGGSKVIWVRSAEQAFLRAASAILDGTIQGNIIVAEAGNLAKGGALRRKFEESDKALIVPVYEQEASEAWHTVRTALSAAGLDIERDALALLLGAAGPSASLLLREVEKLSAYCMGRDTVETDDVRAVCSMTFEVETDDLVDATFGGDVTQTDRCFQQLVQAGVDPSRILASALGHATRLLDCLRNIDRGMRIEQALRSTQPPLFFKRQTLVQTQLNSWTLDALLSAAASLYAAVNQSRQYPRLAGEITSRTLLAVARIPRSRHMK